MKNIFKETDKSKSIFRTLQYRNYRLFFTGQCVSLIGTWIQIIAASWLTYRLTNSAFLLGFITFAGQIPTLLLTPIAGVLVDRWNRYKLLKTTQILFALQSGIFGLLVLTGYIQIWHILVLNIYGGLVMSFDSPVRQSFISDMIEDRKDLGSAIALNSMLFNLARMIGPPIAGVLVALTGEGWCFMINTFSFVFIIVNLYLMKVRHVERKKEQLHIIKELKEGFKYTYEFIPIRYVLIVLALVSIVGMSMNVLMPIYTKDILGGNSHILGFLMGAMGLGSLFGGFGLAIRNSNRGLENKIFMATMVLGSSLLLLPVLKNYWFGMFIMAMLGFGMITQIIASNTMIQTLVDDDKRGRVMGIYSMAFMGTAPLGSLLAGTMSDIFGVLNTSLIAGICVIIAGIYFSSKIPKIREIAEIVYNHDLEPADE